MNENPSTLPANAARRYLSIDSLIEFCRDNYDLSLSKPTIYRAKRAGELHPLKRSGRLLFRITDVERWIEGSFENEGGA